MLVDAFMFFNELDVLEIRLNSLAKDVDLFILCEGTHTHAGDPKPLYFQENQDRFKDFPIRYVLYRNDPGQLPWHEENAQRDYMWEFCGDLPQDAVIMISDCDEIPNLEDYPKGSNAVFRNMLFYFWLNAWTGQTMRGTIAMRHGDINRSFSSLRRRRYRMGLPVYDGWHFGYLGDPHVKINALAHTEFNTPEVHNRLDAAKADLFDPFARGKQHFSVAMPSGPKWLLDNIDRYKQYIYPDPEQIAIDNLL